MDRKVDGGASVITSYSIHYTKLYEWHFQRKDEHALLEVFENDFHGYEEPHDIREVMELARPYLVPEGTLGEMLLSVGKTVYLYRKGADGILDINPFSCMNGIVSRITSYNVCYTKLLRQWQSAGCRPYRYDRLNRPDRQKRTEFDRVADTAPCVAGKN